MYLNITFTLVTKILEARVDRCNLRSVINKPGLKVGDTDYPTVS